ncbi:LexA family protein [Devosia naphthalenivorans]|uniref:LexA family protein n=1 Tax=Devosia naphthalenivorans TaxID=2082392 RepID=UPI000D3862E3|nr:helix-turn-helix domain-containing protein [Devosia naphthalenivorans]
MTRPADIPENIYERAEVLMDQFSNIEDDRELIARVLMAVGQGASTHVGVTHEQVKVLNFVRAFQAKHNGVSPTYDEIAQALGRSKSNIHDFLHRMADRGIVRLATRARSITIIAGAAEIAAKQHVNDAHTFKNREA